MGLSKAKTGPLSTATLYQISDVVFFGSTQPPIIDPVTTDYIYTVKNSDRLDLIAARELGDVQLGWIILERNNLRLAPNDLVPGMLIYIPTRESLRQRGIIG